MFESGKGQGRDGKGERDRPREEREGKALVPSWLSVRVRKGRERPREKKGRKGEGMNGLLPVECSRKEGKG